MYDTGYRGDSIFSEHTQHRGICADPTPLKLFSEPDLPEPGALEAGAAQQ